MNRIMCLHANLELLNLLKLLKNIQGIPKHL
jgi:hypothetical protein